MRFNRQVAVFVALSLSLLLSIDAMSGFFHGVTGAQVADVSSCSELGRGIARLFSVSCSSSAYEPVSDVNKDKIIDISDLSEVSSRSNSNNTGWCSARLADVSNPCKPAVPAPSLEPSKKPCGGEHEECCDGACLPGLKCSKTTVGYTEIAALCRISQPAAPSPVVEPVPVAPSQAALGLNSEATQ